MCMLVGAVYFLQVVLLDNGVDQLPRVKINQQCSTLTYDGECKFAVFLNEATLLELPRRPLLLHFFELVQDAVVSH